MSKDEIKEDGFKDYCIPHNPKDSPEIGDGGFLDYVDDCDPIPLPPPPPPPLPEPGECPIFFESWETQFAEEAVSIEDIIITYGSGETVQAEVIVSSGDEPYLYRIDGGVWQESPIFTGLIEGATYTFSVRDSFLSVASEQKVVFVPVYEEFEATGIGREGVKQMFEIPATGTYRLSAYGAQGGTHPSGIEGGLGAKMSGVFEFEQGDELEIGVGQVGATATDSYGAGGGGATFVRLLEEPKLITESVGMSLPDSGGGFHSGSSFGFLIEVVEGTIKGFEVEAQQDGSIQVNIMEGNTTSTNGAILQETIQLTAGINSIDVNWNLDKGTYSIIMDNMTAQCTRSDSNPGFPFIGDTITIVEGLGADRYYYLYDFKYEAVVAPVNFILIAGGGGGGGNYTLVGSAHANITENGNGGERTGSQGGTDGEGGTSGQSAGGGAGLFANGGSSGSIEGGRSLVDSAFGGTANNSSYADGGFGGGGASYLGSGGGGGYSGGGGGGWSLSGEGGGGGSINTGTDQDNETQAQEGRGKLIIERLST